MTVSDDIVIDRHVDSLKRAVSNLSDYYDSQTHDGLIDNWEYAAYQQRLVEVNGLYTIFFFHKNNESVRVPRKYANQLWEAVVRWARLDSGPMPTIYDAQKIRKNDRELLENIKKQTTPEERKTWDPEDDPNLDDD